MEPAPSDDYYKTLIARVDDTLAESQDAPGQPEGALAASDYMKREHHLVGAFYESHSLLTAMQRWWLLLESLLLCLVLSLTMAAGVGGWFAQWFLVTLLWLPLVWALRLVTKKHGRGGLWWPVGAGMVLLGTLIWVIAGFAAQDGPTVDNAFALFFGSYFVDSLLEFGVLRWAHANCDSWCPGCCSVTGYVQA